MKIHTDPQRREGEQYLLRLPPGMRQRLNELATRNGRSVSAEVIDAIDKHLTDAAHITELWEFFSKHKANIEAIPTIIARLHLQ